MIYTKCKACGRDKLDVPYIPYFRYIFGETNCDSCYAAYIDAKINGDKTLLWLLPMYLHIMIARKKVIK